MVNWIVLVAGWLILLVWIIKLVPAIQYLRTHHLWQFSERGPKPEAWPRLSVIVPAKNEAASIGQGLKSLLANDYPRLEIIAINDRSSDQTGELMDALAAGDFRLKVLHVEILPQGWLGKNHAMHLGGKHATGDYLLFTDGDVLFTADALKKSVRVMLNERLDHLTLFPRMIVHTAAENSLISFFGFMFLLGTSSWNIATGKKNSYAGIGAFNMVRAKPYRDTGGHERLRMEVLDDVRLGQMMKDAGNRAQLLIADENVRVRWQSSLWQMIRGLEKNAFSSVGYSLPKLTFVLVTLMFLVYGPWVGLFWFPKLACLGHVIALVVMHIGFGYSARQLQGTAACWPLLEFGAAAFITAYFRSCRITLQQQGVRWRDTFYSLSELRKHRYRSGDH